MKKAYVTGAERGLGLGLVNELIQSDYFVYAGCYLDHLNEIDKLADKYSGKIKIIKLDVTKDESVRQASNIIREDTDQLNLLINNAGSAIDRSGNILEEQYFDDIRMMMEINAYGTLRVTQSVIDLLLKGSPKTLVNISSLAGSVSLLQRTSQYGYTMSKAAVNMQTKMIYNHFADSGLKVHAIHPGWMRTQLFGDIERMKDAPLEPTESAKSIVQLIHDEKQHEIFLDYTGKQLPW